MHGQQGTHTSKIPAKLKMERLYRALLTLRPCVVLSEHRLPSLRPNSRLILEKNIDYTPDSIHRLWKNGVKWICIVLESSNIYNCSLVYYTCLPVCVTLLLIFIHWNNNPSLLNLMLCVPLMSSSPYHMCPCVCVRFLSDGGESALGGKNESPPTPTSIVCMWVLLCRLPFCTSTPICGV